MEQEVKMIVEDDTSLELLKLRQEVCTTRIQLGLAYKRLEIAEEALKLISDLPCLGHKRGPQLAIDALDDMENMT